MSLKQSLIIATALCALLIAATGPAFAERTMYLNVCQELVNQARSYEARAAAHGRIAKSLMSQIESLAKLPKNQGTMAAMDNLFAQYDENRALESKFRGLYKQATSESEQCMKSAD